MVGRLDWGGEDGQPRRTIPKITLQAKETYRKVCMHIPRGYVQVHPPRTTCCRCRACFGVFVLLLLCFCGRCWIVQGWPVPFGFRVLIVIFAVAAADQTPVSLVFSVQQLSLNGDAAACPAVIFFSLASCGDHTIRLLLCTDVTPWFRV